MEATKTLPEIRGFPELMQSLLAREPRLIPKRAPNRSLFSQVASPTSKNAELGTAEMPSCAKRRRQSLFL